VDGAIGQGVTVEEQQSATTPRLLVLAGAPHRIVVDGVTPEDRVVGQTRLVLECRLSRQDSFLADGVHTGGVHTGRFHAGSGLRSRRVGLGC
jgi:hypothetical protein